VYHATNVGQMQHSVPSFVAQFLRNTLHAIQKTAKSAFSSSAGSLPDSDIGGLQAGGSTVQSQPPTGPGIPPGAGCFRGWFAQFALAFYFGDADWILSKNIPFPMKLRDHTSGVERRLRAEKRTVTSGRVLAEQHLGIWTDLFEKGSFKIFQGSPIHVFKNPPPALTRKDVSARLNQIRLFRNRINHNEPICFQGNAIDLTYAQNVYATTCEVLTWIDPDILIFLRDLDKIPSQITRMQRI